MGSGGEGIGGRGEGEGREVRGEENGGEEEERGRGWGVEDRKGRELRSGGEECRVCGGVVS